MATTFNLTTYPLDDSTRFSVDVMTITDQMDSGAVSVRVMSNDTYGNLRCVFSPMTESQSANFHSYLITNRATEFDIAYNGKTYRGYIDGRSIDYRVRYGEFHFWSFDFRGAVQ